MRAIGRPGLYLLLALLLSACASAPVADTAALFDDGDFAPRNEAIDGDGVLAPSPRMLDFVASDIAPAQRRKGARQALVDALYKGRGEPWLDYEATLTRTAAEAFDSRSGNCLSLVLMTSAFARQLGVDVRYQLVFSQQSWSRDDELSYLNQHVNLVLLQPPAKDQMLVDFAPLPGEEGKDLRFRVVGEDTIVAMYMNNRAVELLAQHQFDRAYWWARAAIERDPGFLDAVNTLAVLYRSRNRPDQAERVLRFLLAIEPDNIVALENLESVLRETGRDGEADRLALRVKQLRPVPPFRSYDEGMVALGQGRYEQARNLFEKEMRRDARYDKFHAALALAYFGLGELEKAQAQMDIAVRNATTTADRELYARMLAKLRAGQPP
jgi:tetratricopeptide (TPR) repeat protein